MKLIEIDSNSRREISRQPISDIQYCIDHFSNFEYIQ